MIIGFEVMISKAVENLGTDLILVCFDSTKTYNPTHSLLYLRSLIAYMYLRFRGHFVIADYRLEFITF